MKVKKNSIDNSETIQYSELPNEEQVTSVPEKTIGDE
jgi:hypothetical protein